MGIETDVGSIRSLLQLRGDEQSDPAAVTIGTPRERNAPPGRAYWPSMVDTAAGTVSHQCGVLVYGDPATVKPEWQRVPDFIRVLGVIGNDPQIVVEISGSYNLVIGSLWGEMLQIERLEQRYSFRDREEVLSFLESNSFLVPLLFEIRQQLDHYLTMTEIYLKVVAEPDSYDDEQLVVSIVPGMEPDVAYDRLEAFDDDWWLDNIEAADNKVCITLEFR